MKFSLATLHVQDMEKAVAFYNGLLEIPIIRRQPIGGGKELMFMGVDGQPNLELIPSTEPVSYSGFSIGFDVEDLEAIKQKLAQNGYPVKHEMTAGPSTVLCFLQGPNGEEVELIYYR